ncbi:MAG: SpaA isopeptide-forming pilin-related protein [Bacilli bacterium]|nr:SpaA isopeptide-forming pilin-related protein [Bacilli bacterium]
MNKIIEKSKKFLTLILVAAIAIVTVTTSTKAITETINVGDAQDLEAYIGGVRFATKTTTDGGYLYCLEMAKKTTMNTTATYTGVRDAGIAYIVMNGYPTKSFTGDALKDYYITQTAIWWYLDETTGSTNLGEQFKELGSDPYNMRGYVKALVQGGVQAKAQGYATTSINVSTESDKLSLDGAYYSSKVVNVTTNASTYTVSLEGATAGTKVVGATTGTEATTLNSTEGFIIKVPVTEVTSTSLNVKVNITANGVSYKALEYTPGNPDMQKVTPGIIQPTEEKVTTSINLGLSTTKVRVIKYDSTTNQPLGGAVLVVKDSNGEVITRWTSTTNAHVIRNLSAGSYTVEEEKAPTGYEKSNEKVPFTIAGDSDDVTVKFMNTPKEKTVVNITKIDSETGNALAGAVLVIKDATGTEVDRFTSTTESHVITGLAYGKYTVSEVSAPAGYKTSEEVIEFTLDDEHISYQIQFANYKEVYVPDTNVNNLLFTVLGIAIIGSGLGFVYKNGKKDETK